MNKNNNEQNQLTKPLDLKAFMVEEKVKESNFTKKNQKTRLRGQKQSGTF